jgi:hypothetical protein
VKTLCGGGGKGEGVTLNIGKWEKGWNEGRILSNVRNAIASKRQ